MKNLPKEIFDREKSLVGFSSSLLKHFHVEPFHETDPEIDRLLEGHKKVCVFLFDGAGKYNISLFPHTNKYLISHQKCVISSTNPPTTVAATNAFLTAKWPKENGWMGWTQYIPSLHFPLCVFPDVNDLTGEKVDYYHDGSHFFDRYCPLKKIDVLMLEKGVNAKLEYLYPLGGEKAPKNYKEMVQHATSFFKNGGEFLYSYTPHPDKELHQYGVKSLSVWNEFRKINKMIRQFVKENPDVLVISMADHGLINVKYQDIALHKELADCLSLPMSLEGRNATFFVKEGKKEEFASLFTKYYPDFVLLTKKEVLEENIFGVGEENPHFQEFIGDFLAIAVGENVLWNSKQALNKKTFLKAHHAGETKEEREIALSFYNL